MLELPHHCFHRMHVHERGHSASMWPCAPKLMSLLPVSLIVVMQQGWDSKKDVGSPNLDVGLAYSALRYRDAQCGDDLVKHAILSVQHAGLTIACCPMCLMCRVGH